MKINVTVENMSVNVEEINVITSTYDIMNFY